MKIHRTLLAMCLASLSTLAACTQPPDVTQTTIPTVASTPLLDTPTHGSSSDSLSLWSQQIDRILSSTFITPFEKDVLSDYAVTDDEYHQAQAKFVSCMADQQWTAQITDHGYEITNAAGSVPAEDTVQNCITGTLAYIEPLYLGMLDNPDGLSRTQLVRACFETHGVTEADGLSDADFTVLLDDEHYHPSSPEGKMCFYDPTGSIGMSSTQAETLDANKDQ